MDIFGKNLSWTDTESIIQHAIIEMQMWLSYNSNNGKHDKARKISNEIAGLKQAMFLLFRQYKKRNNKLIAKYL